METIRLAELLGSLSLATDLAAGLPVETAVRTSLVAVRLGAAAGFDGFALQDVYYTGLLRFLGCSAYAHEMARMGGGEDQAYLAALTPADPTKVGEILARATGRVRGAGAKARAVLEVLSHPKTGEELHVSHCELAVRLAGQLGMSTGVVAALGEMYERWDGKGHPQGLRGDAIRPVARVLHVAWRLAAHHALGEAPLEVIAARSGREFEPALAALAQREGEGLLAEGASCWSAFLAAEPKPHLLATRARLPSIAFAFACFADVKSPWTAGHSVAVADLAAAAHPADAERARLAGLLHDLGRVAVPNGIWDKRGPLDAIERDRARTHAYETERILARAPGFSELASDAAIDHERVDGTGYHRRLPSAALPRLARVLAASDVLCALGEERPHRRAYTPAATADILAREARAGRLCPDAVDAVLAARGHARTRAANPAALTEREIEVLRLVARGAANKEVAARLDISEKTVKRHLENVYDKIGARSRAAASVYAIEHDLL